MNAYFSWFEVLVLVGVVQGFLIALLILANRPAGCSKLLLAFILIAFNLLCIRIIILTTGLWQTPLLRYLPLPLELAIQPLLWLYTLSLVRPGFKLNRHYLFHFIPFLLSLIYSALVYITGFGEKAAAKDIAANNLYFDEVKKAEDYLTVVSALVYWLLGLQLILKYRKWVYNNISNTSYPTYAWLRNISFLTGILIVIFAIDIFLDYFFNFGFNSFTHWKFFFVYLSALIYYLGFRGFQLQAENVLFFKNVAVYQVSEIEPVQLPDAHKTFEDTAPGKEIEPGVMLPTFPEPGLDTDLTPVNTLKLSEERITEIENAVKNAFENRQLYLDPELNLNKLAKAIELPPVQVSYVINNKFKKAFRNLVNEYRVAKVKDKLADPRSRTYSILGIAYECGFNSEASFYRIFKSIAGLSPKEYYRSLVKELP